MGQIADRFKAKRLKIKPDSKGLTLAQVLSNPATRAAYEEAKRLREDYVGGIFSNIIVDELMEKTKKKGQYNGLCNRTACQSPNDVRYYNRHTYAFYCRWCTDDINGFQMRHGRGDVFIAYKTPEEAKEVYVKDQ